MGEITRSRGNVFEDLGYDAENAASLLARVDLMIFLRRLIKERGLRQREAAELFGVSQPRISDLVNQHVDKFSIDALVNMIAKAGFRVMMSPVPEEVAGGGMEPA